MTRQKIGQSVRCPECAGKVVVPESEQSNVQEQTRESALPNATSPSIAPSMQPSDVATASIPRSPAVDTARPTIASTPAMIPDSQPNRPAPRKVSARTITVSRRVIYLQGMLLIIVAIAAFTLGVLFAQSGNGTLAKLNSPRRVTGRVTFRRETGELAGDSEAVVVILPAQRWPDEKLDVTTLRPEAPPPGRANATIGSLRSIGGDFTRAGPDGDFALEVPRAGKYFFLLLSSHTRRAADKQPSNQELAQLARYFVPADELLGMNAYRWSSEVVRDDMELNHSFE